MNKKVNIKNKLVFSLFLILMFITSFCMTSCENFFSNENADGKNSSNGNCGQIKITVNQTQNTQKNLRTILPDINLLNINSLTLAGIHDGQNYTLGSWDSVSALSADTINLEYGEWILTLNAINDNFTFTDSTSIYVSLEQIQQVIFNLSSDINRGGLSLKIILSGNASKASCQLYTYPDNLQIDNDNISVVSSGTNKYLLYERKTESTLLADGTYRIKFNFYGGGEQPVLLNNYSEIIRVKGGFISRAERNIDLNQLYKITYDFDGGQITGDIDVIENYSSRSEEISLPHLQKNGYIFEGWYNDSDTRITSIVPSMACDINLHAVFIIELKEGPEINDILTQWSNAKKFLPSTTGPAGSVTDYLDTSTNIPVWYDSSSQNVYFYCAGYTDSNGTKKLILRPDSSKFFQSTSYSEIDLSYFDTSRVTNMGYMFDGANNLFSLNLNSFNTGHVTDMTHMFYGASNLHAIYVSEDFVTSSVVNDLLMFSGNSLLKGENNTAYSDSNTGKTYARFDATGTPGYFSHSPAEDTYYISYVLNNGTNAASNPACYTSSNLPITLADPTGQNASGDAFQFEGWYKTENFASGSQVTSITDISNGNFTLYAKWKVPYRVRHYFENAEDTDYSIAQDNVQTKYGYAGNSTEAEHIATSVTNVLVGSLYVRREGFNTQTIAQKTIDADGETVVNVYYNRKVITVTFGLDGGNIAGDTSDVVRSGKYGALMPAVDTSTIVKTGYTFSSWLEGATICGFNIFVNYTYPYENKTYKPNWNPATDTPYIVKHLQQDVTGSGYTEVEADRQNLTGTTGYTTNAAAKNYTGFTAQSITQKTIAADGSTIVEIKYDRKTYTVSYTHNITGETITMPSDTTSYRHGATVTVNFPATQPRTGYTLSGWQYGGNIYTVSNNTFTITSNVTLSAQWNPIEYTITYNLNEGINNSLNPISYTVEDVDFDLQDPSRTDYVFCGWYENSDFSGERIETIHTNDLSGITVYAKWICLAAYTAITEIQNASSGDTVEITGQLDSDGLSAICEAVKEKTVPIGLNLENSGITSLPQNAFENSQISSVKLPSEITRINKNVFKGCSNLSIISFNGTIENWKYVSFGEDWRTNILATEVVCTDGNQTMGFIEKRPTATYGDHSTQATGTGSQDDPFILPSDQNILYIRCLTDGNWSSMPMDSGFFSYGTSPYPGEQKLTLSNYAVIADSGSTVRYKTTITNPSSYCIIYILVLPR